MLNVAHRDLLVDRAKFLTEAGLSAVQLDRALLANRVFLVRLHGQEYIPDFFLDERYDRRQLQAVCKVLGDLPGARIRHKVLELRLSRGWISTKSIT